MIDYSQQHEDAISAQERADEIAAASRPAYILECYRNREWRESGRCYKLEHAVKVADNFAQCIRVRTGGQVVYTNKAEDARQRSKARTPMMQDKVIHYEEDGDVLFAAG